MTDDIEVESSNDLLEEHRADVPRIATATAHAIDALHIAESTFDEGSTALATTSQFETYLAILSTLVWGIPNFFPTQMR